jgi:hypothetical protein
MGEYIPNYGAALSKKYKGDSYKDIKGLHIKSLFRMVVLGPSFSGKNNLVFYMLQNSPDTFSHLHIIARNSDQELYNYLRDKLAGFITFHDPDHIPSVDTIRKTKENAPELVLIDDYSNDANLQKNVFSHYYTRGRHFKLSTIFLSHSWFKGTDKMIRTNCEYVAVLRANSKRDLLLILKDFNIDISEANFYEAYRRATAQKGQCLFIDSVNSQIRYNFNVLVDTKTLETKKIN